MLVGLVVAQAALAAPALQWGACPDSAQSKASAAVMRCGWLETGTTLAGKPVRLRVTRLRVRPDRPSRHPIVYVPGGPGDPGGQNAPALRRWQRFQQRAGWPRDLVIFDPRGTGESQPRPQCPKLRPGDGRNRLADCFRALGRTTAQKLGVRAQVADLHRLVQALDGGSVILWADSFGAVIARDLRRRHPADVQALILDSPVLNPAALNARRQTAFARQRAQLIAACRQHLACRLALPPAPIVIDGLLASVSRRPIRLATAEVPYRARSVTVDAETLRAMLLLTAYGPDSRAPLIDRLRRALKRPRALWPLARPLAALAGRRRRTAPVYWSTRCALVGAAARVDNACRDWPVAAQKPRVSRPPRGFVPTLALAGAHDVLTPLSATAGFVRAHPGRQLLIVRNSAHDVLAGDACAQRVVRRFIISGGAWLGAPQCDAWTSGGRRGSR